MRLIQNIPKTPNGICIVGEAPGADEEKYGKPFIGWEGQYLRRQLKAAGINFHECYVTNTVHVRPPRNNYDALTSAQISEGISQLKKDIEHWRPNVVIAVGAKALKALTGHTQITQFRGAVIESTLVPGQKVVATIHPGGILRGGEKMGRYEPIQILDFKKALRESRFPEIVYPERNILSVYSQARALELLESVTDIPDPVAVDIETIGPTLSAYGIATSKSEAFVITKDLLRDPTILRAVARFAFSSTPKIFHNALFDCLHGLGYYKIITNNILCDTMIAQHAAYPTLPKSLAFCASIYTNEVYWKSEGKTIFDDIKRGRTVDWESFYIYNGKDCCLTYEIYEILMKEIDEWGARRAFDLMMSLIPPCLFAMLRGTKISMYKLLQFKEENEKAIEVLTRIKDAVIGDVNVQSHKQLKELIYDKWDMPKQFRGKRLTVDDKKLAMLERYPTPYRHQIGMIRLLKKYLKRRDFYNLKTNEDGRIRTALKITGTYTGRFSSSESIFGSGKNLLNIPKETRKFYVADDDKIMIQGDLSQAEARIVAALCGDEKWLREFDEIDVHRKVAAGLFNVPFDQVTKYQRNIAKRVAHGCVDGFTEILTPSGWKYISHYDGTEPLYIVFPQLDGLGLFAYPDEFAELHYKGPMVHFRSPGIDQFVTIDHYLPIKTSSGRVNKVQTSELIKKKDVRLPKTVKNIGIIDERPEMLQLFIAFQADGTASCKYTLDWHFVKNRKIARLVHILASLDIPYHYYTNKDGTTKISVRKSDVPGWIWKKSLKDLAFLTLFKHDCLQVMSRELTKWDGHEGRTARRFITTDMEVAKGAQLLHALSGLGGGNIYIKPPGEYSTKPNLVVALNNRKNVRIGGHIATVKDWEGTVYNVGVPSGYYLIRRNGVISVTGNTHYGLGKILLSEILGCSPKEAQTHKDRYYELRPKLKDWQERVKHTVRTKRVLRTVFGRVIQFFGPITDKLYRDAVASEPQSTSADYLNTGLVRLYEHNLPWWEFLLSVYDSILCQVPDNLDVIEETIQTMKELVEIEIVINGLPMVIPLSFELGYSWGEMIEIEDDDIESAYRKLQR